MAKFFDDGLFIELIKQYPNLWDKHNLLFKTPNAAENSWRAIGIQMNCSVNDCKARWAAIRSRYGKERRLYKQSVVSGGPSYKILWPHYTACSFLDKIVLTRRSRSSMKSTENAIHDLTNDSIRENDETQKWDTMKIFVSPNEICVDNELCSQNGVVNIIESDTSDAEQSYSDVQNFSRSVSPIGSGTSSRSLDSRSKTKRKHIGQNPEISDMVSAVTQSCDVFKTANVPLDIDPSEWYFAKSLAQSLTHIKNKRNRLKVKAKMLQLLAEEGDWEDE